MEVLGLENLVPLQEEHCQLCLWSLTTAATVALGIQWRCRSHDGCAGQVLTVALHDPNAGFIVAHRQLLLHLGIVWPG